MTKPKDTERPSDGATPPATPLAPEQPDGRADRVSEGASAAYADAAVESDATPDAASSGPGTVEPSGRADDAATARRVPDAADTDDADITDNEPDTEPAGAESVEDYVSRVAGIPISRRAEAAVSHDVDATDTKPDDRPANEKAFQPKAPFITAVEIENFKGIGAPVRIDFKPVTLLFGRNSAGKSTIIHALSYAHEILNHRNCDAHKTDLGGDQIDLGGFDRFVHRHDIGRSVRFRFDLNLENWSVLHGYVPNRFVPSEIDERAEPHSWIAEHYSSDTVRTASVIITVARDKRLEAFIPTDYELRVNGSFVGSIGRTRRILTLNWRHPIFEPFRTRRPVSVPQTTVTPGGKAPTLDRDRLRLHHGRFLPGTEGALPNWNEILRVDERDLEHNEDVDIGGVDSTSYIRFTALITNLFTGIGCSLRDDLAALRYLGPLREIHLSSAIFRDQQQRTQWSDGSAAWSRLYEGGFAVDREGGLLENVNRWLKDSSKLDTGYKVRRNSFVKLSTERHPVDFIRECEAAFSKYRGADGVIDVDGMVRDHARKPQTEQAFGTNMLNTFLLSYVAAQWGWTESGLEACKTRADVENWYRHRLTEFAGDYASLESGNSSTDIKALFRAIGTAPYQTELEIVTADTDLAVRTSDIGVGVSQILPVVVAALDRDRPGITAIEQPELHVHPKMQVELGDLFAQDADSGRVFLIETHSEHLILRLLRRIEETHSGELPEGKPALRPDQVSVVFLEQVDGEVRATRLRIDESGEFIDRWPEGFFEERSGELFY